MRQQMKTTAKIKKIPTADNLIGKMTVHLPKIGKHRHKTIPYFPFYSNPIVLFRGEGGGGSGLGKAYLTLFFFLFFFSR